ncbi:MAG: YceH family protein, partial [Ilumatobacter sp.]|nr:YceH family protein [Ilumatobacter sp.]
MLSVVEARVLGCLLEKERTTPDQYPLTLNALVSACNQSTSREPVMHLDDHEVDAVLVELKAEGLLRFVHPSHGRSVTRYRQVADEAWGLDAPSAAVVAVLLLRGPQTVAELRTRTERLHAFESVEAVDTALQVLAAQGQVRLLDRQPGQKEARWQQLLAEEA